MRYKQKIVQVYALTTLYSEDINSFYSDTDETLRKPNDYTIVMRDFNAQVGKRRNPMETATGKFGLELRNKRRNLGRMGNIKKEQNHEYLVSEECREEMDVEKSKRCNEDQH